MTMDAVTPQELHQKLTVQYFNETWDFIDKTDRTPEETLQMIHLAHASRFHWGQAGTPLHFLRGEWQLARVHALAGMGQSALYHAQHCLNICLAENSGDVDLAFAHEALARAYKMCGEDAEALVHLKAAFAAAETIVKQENKDYLLSELQSIS